MCETLAHLEVSIFFINLIIFAAFQLFSFNYMYLNILKFLLTTLDRENGNKIYSNNSSCLLLIKNKTPAMTRFLSSELDQTSFFVLSFTLLGTLS